MGETFNGYIDKNGSSLTQLAPDIYLPAVLGHYSVADAQTKPGPPARFLGGEEWVEYPSQIFRGDTRAVVSE